MNAELTDHVTHPELFEPLAVEVPGQMPPHCYPLADSDPPDIDDGDQHVLGDHDLHSCRILPTLPAALAYYAACAGEGIDRIHQGSAQRTLIREQLLALGVIEADD